ncbi:hypothetical protein NM208_g1759 [Fusarium decemcellulare]|uniref:Uncharacterized protein n=1 Tax=Fusarium decemcellulare TaxID=57161 RepID=A0ACC1SUT9_9HYPO|nr:hypothetical protein NM208_g1759 [Fusarium decemcellulare]
MSKRQWLYSRKPHRACQALRWLRPYAEIAPEVVEAVNATDPIHRQTRALGASSPEGGGEGRRPKTWRDRRGMDMETNASYNDSTDDESGTEGDDYRDGDSDDYDDDESMSLDSDDPGMEKGSP